MSTAPQGTRYRPYSNGEQDGCWFEKNCEECAKCGDLDDSNTWTCPIQIALQDSFWDDGTVNEEIARRMGYLDNQERYCWECPERKGQDV